MALNGVPMFAAMMVSLTALAGLGATPGDAEGEGGASPGAESAGSYVTPPTPLVDAGTMLAEHKAFVKTYPKRVDNHADHVGARNALAAEFAAAGLSVWRQPFVNGIPQENICAAQFGSVYPTVWVVVGGHYDTTTWDGMVFDEPAPDHMVSEGAYDDGSGTRMMVSMAKAWKASVTPAYSILWCAFDGEERGLQGSAKVKQAMGTSAFPWTVTATRGMMEMDMFGLNWPLRAPIFVDANKASIQNWVTGIRVAKGIPSDMLKFRGACVSLPTGGCYTLGTSDYVHWRNAGVPTLIYLSDFGELGVPGSGLVPGTLPFPSAQTGLYPFWHQTDTYETMLAMAGDPITLTASFQTALDFAGETIALFALHPEIAL